VEPQEDLAMTDADGPSPYRHDLDAAFARISDLEAQLAGHRPAAAPVAASDPQVHRALCALRVNHLHEDRAALVARHHSLRRGTLATTCVAMLGAFAWFVRAARLDPAAATSTWALCGLVVSVLAATGLALQTALRARDLRRLRTIDRRIAEERVLAGLPAAEPARALASARVRVALADPLASPDEVEAAADPLHEAQPAHVIARR
jgi:hypothetical protein